MTDRGAGNPLGVDITCPSAARVYDAYLGGAHNFQVDREFFNAARENLPHVADVARWNRAFLRRAVEAMSEAGIKQFLDLGSGLPTVGPTHEIARAHHEDARVVYVDNELVAVVHTEEIIRGLPNTGAVHADVLDARSVLHAPVTRDILDFSEPIGILAVALLHFVPDSQRPTTVLEPYKTAVAEGSHLAVSHATVDGVPEPVRSQTLAFIDSYKDTQNPGFTARSRQQFREFFAGWELIEPGMAFTSEWRTDIDEDASPQPENAVCLGGVARKLG